jgi:hypothetical protein
MSGSVVCSTFGAAVPFGGTVRSESALMLQSPRRRIAMNQGTEASD